MPDTRTDTRSGARDGVQTGAAGPLPRGLRNANPGNIRRSADRFRGEIVPSRDPLFKQFESLEWGLRALFVVLDTYRHRHGLRRLADFIARWAPPSENDTAAYLRTVAARTGLDPAAVIDTRHRSTMLAVAGAIVQVACGVPVDPAALRRGWERFIADRPESPE